jgi:hypothetical protein
MHEEENESREEQRESRNSGENRLKTAPIPSTFYCFDRKVLRFLIGEYLLHGGLRSSNEYGTSYDYLFPFV